MLGMLLVLPLPSCFLVWFVGPPAVVRVEPVHLRAADRAEEHELLLAGDLGQ